MKPRHDDDCDAEAAGSGTTDGAAAEYDPLAEPEDEVTSTPKGSRSIKRGLPVSDAAYRSLKEQAKRERRTPDSSERTVAQEDGHGGSKDGGEKG